MLYSRISKWQVQPNNHFHWLPHFDVSHTLLASELCGWSFAGTPTDATLGPENVLLSETYISRAYKNSTMIARHGSYLGQIYLNCKHVISYQSTKDPSAASLLSQDIGQTPWRYSSVFTLHHLGGVILGTLAQAQSSSLSNSMKSTNKYMLWIRS